jgi:ATP synthase protein I
MSKRKEPPDGLVRSVHERRRRRERREREGERSLADDLVWMGAIGWLVVTPLVAGLFLGQWLDHKLGQSPTWTITCLFLGLVLGCWLAWRRISHP